MNLASLHKSETKTSGVALFVSVIHVLQYAKNFFGVKRPCRVNVIPTPTLLSPQLINA